MFPLITIVPPRSILEIAQYAVIGDPESSGMYEALEVLWQLLDVCSVPGFEELDDDRAHPI